VSASPYKNIFQLEIENYKIWFHYQYGNGTTSVVELNPLQSQSQHLNEDEWHLITVTIIDTDLSYFIDGQFIKSTLLKGSINDPGGRIRIGQKYGG
jgi:usherin